MFIAFYITLLYNTLMCAVSLRKIAGKQYAYRVSREGTRLVQTYLGRIDDPKVRETLQAEEALNAVPQSVKALFWETDPSRLDPKKHGNAIIRKVLEYGSLDDFRWVERRYGLRRIERIVELGRGLSPRTVGFYRLWLH